MWNFFFNWGHRKALVDEPWRKTEGWGKSVRKDLKQHVARLAPKCRGDIDVPSSFRVVLTGHIGDGKSSVINSLKSVYKNKIVLVAGVGDAATSSTTKFRVYKIMEEVSLNPLPWKICDTMGLSSSSDDQDVKYILSAVDGHVPDGHEFNGEYFTQNSRGYISNPAIADKAHCIAVVIAADKFVHMGDEMKEKLKYLRRELIGREIPTFIILTKVDLVCEAVKRDVTNVYRSIAVRDLLSQVGKMLGGLPEDQIFPVVNYKEQTKLDENMDILLLYAVRQMQLYSAQAYLEKYSRQLTEEPWRKTVGWGESVCEELKQLVAQLAPKCRGNMNVSSFRVILTGKISDGKSSVINSLNNVYRDKVDYTYAGVGERSKSLTKEFRVYEIRKEANCDPLPWKICDTMGLSPGPDNKHDVKNILSAVDGHVPDRYEFTMTNFTQNHGKYISNPAIADRAHCIAVVIAADNFVHMGDEMVEKLKNLRVELIDRDIPTFIILTKVDLVCKAMGRDVTTVYRSVAVRDLVSKVSKMLHGLPEGQIFPVVNYKRQTELDNNMDILLLYAVRQMLYSAQAYLEKRM